MNDAKQALAEKIITIKRKKGFKWGELAAAIGMSPVWTAAACMGQMSFEPAVASKAAAFLGLDAEEEATLCEIPYRGALPPGPPTDPTIYRFHELIQVYGPAWKSLIHEEFGDGIMSAIDFDMTLTRQPDPAGDRVRIEMTGKFLKYKRY
jgi:cyanate lyase